VTDIARTPLSANDLERSCTCWSLPTVVRTLRQALSGRPPGRILDVGCGYGGVAAALRDALGADEVHGIDIDAAVVQEATAKGVEVTVRDAAAQGLPYDDGTFGLVTCFGMLDYLPCFDGVVADISRVLTPDGVVAVSLPNLASWHNRLALLLGYQPRDVEFSALGVFGVAPAYGRSLPVGHIHTTTATAFRRYMMCMGFEAIRTVALRPSNARPALPLAAVDQVLGRLPSMSRRFLYVGRRVTAPDPTPDRGPGWWSGPAPAR
jgi:SAM-dependent methyltransferase